MLDSGFMRSMRWGAMDAMRNSGFKIDTGFRKLDLY